MLASIHTHCLAHHRVGFAIEDILGWISLDQAELIEAHALGGRNGAGPGHFFCGTETDPRTPQQVGAEHIQFTGNDVMHGIEALEGFDPGHMWVGHQQRKTIKVVY